MEPFRPGAMAAAAATTAAAAAAAAVAPAAAAAAEIRRILAVSCAEYIDLDSYEEREHAWRGRHARTKADARQIDSAMRRVLGIGAAAHSDVATQQAYRTRDKLILCVGANTADSRGQAGAARRLHIARAWLLQRQ